MQSYVCFFVLCSRILGNHFGYSSARPSPAYHIGPCICQTLPRYGSSPIQALSKLYVVYLSRGNPVAQLYIWATCILHQPVRWNINCIFWSWLKFCFQWKYTGEHCNITTSEVILKTSITGIPLSNELYIDELIILRLSIAFNFNADIVCAKIA